MAMGGYADVYKGTLVVKKTNESVKVAAKRIRCMLAKEKEFARVSRRPVIDLVTDLTVCVRRHLLENSAFGQGLITRTSYR